MRSRKSQPWLATRQLGRRSSRSLRCQQAWAGFLPGLILALLVTPAYAQPSDAMATIGRGRDVLQINSTFSASVAGSYGTTNVTIACVGGPSKADRDLRIVLYISNYGSGMEVQGQAIEKMVRLPEGSSTVTLQIPFMQASNMRFDVGVFEDGRDIEDKRGTKQRNAMIGSFLNVGTTVFGLGTIATDKEWADSKYHQAITKLQSRLSYNNPNQQAGSLAHPVKWDEASSDWRTYTSRSLWIVSAQSLLDLKNQRPASAQALVDYVAAGGRLAIYDTGWDKDEDRGPLALASQVFGGLSQQLEWHSVASPKSQWWTRSKDELQSVPLSGSTVVVGDAGYGGGGYGNTGYGNGGYGVTPGGVRADGSVVIRLPNGTTQVVTPAVAEPEDEDTAPLETQLRGIAFDAALATETWLRSGLGSHLRMAEDVAEALRDRDGYGLKSEAVANRLEAMRTQVLQSLSKDQILSARFHAGELLVFGEPPFLAASDVVRKAVGPVGGSLHHRTDGGADGNWFFRNLISAVGKPPVWAFCIVVALFGALLGPGLLLLTARMQRRSLMIFFVPAVSLIATLAIVAYGILHEGFDTHLKVTSVQWIDGKSGYGFAWSRQNYFSGMPSREGLKFKADTYVRSVFSGGGGSYTPDPRDAVTSRVQLGEQQRWTGWLKSRTQQQLFVGHRLENAELPIQVERMASTKLALTNVTDGVLPVFLFRDAAGYYFADDLQPGETREVDVEQKSVVAAKVARKVAEVKPEPPEELKANGGSLIDFGYSNRWSGRGEADDVLNAAFRENMSDRFELPIGGFSLLSRRSNALELPIEGTMDTSLHLIMGVENW